LALWVNKIEEVSFYFQYSYRLSINFPAEPLFFLILFRKQLVYIHIPDTFFNMQIADLDTVDLQILRLLQKDASLTNKEIAFELDKSVATIHERIRKLKEQGYIKKIVALLDRKKINRGLIAFSQVLLNDHTAQTLATFEKEVSRFPEVMECFQMTGTFDFILRIATSDMDAYHDFYRNKLATLPNITTVQSFFVLSETKSITAYPI
jgi:Lrp/AsnC family leucine-responsive transcriptional regulator